MKYCSKVAYQNPCGSILSKARENEEEMGNYMALAPSRARSMHSNDATTKQ